MSKNFEPWFSTWKSVMGTWKRAVCGWTPTYLSAHKGARNWGLKPSSKTSTLFVFFNELWNMSEIDRSQNQKRVNRSFKRLASGIKESGLPIPYEHKSMHMIIATSPILISCPSLSNRRGWTKSERICQSSPTQKKRDS